MDWVFVTLVAAGVVAGLVKVRRQERRRQRVWRQVALARDGVYHEPHGFIRSQHDMMDIDVGEVRVRFDRYEAGGNNHRRLFTRCRARYLVPRGPVFAIHAEGVLASIGKALGGQDVRLGTDREFDRRFIVKCEDAEAMRQVWSPQAMRIMLRSFDTAQIESNGAEITLTTADPLDVPGLVDEALELMSDIAGVDMFGIAALRALPGVAYQPPSGSWDDRTIPHVVIAHPAPVTLAPAVLGRRIVTRATIGDGPRERPLKILVRADGSSEPADSVARLPPAAAGFLRRAGNGTLVVDGARTSFTWLDLETDPARLMAAVKLLATLAGAPAQGVYR
jgi:hypothetical protein